MIKHFAMLNALKKKREKHPVKMMRFCLGFSFLFPTAKTFFSC